ncbi:hypothetical protein M2171_001392 [Bradyrhizobium japonicum USDA 38]|nr:hypothetical protein [Bradyrhizobium japonicum USDA 38]MCS3944773.1 hypothetical protein [Bradyrhizobium japonicum]
MAVLGPGSDRPAAVWPEAQRRTAIDCLFVSRGMPPPSRQGKEAGEAVAGRRSRLLPPLGPDPSIRGCVARWPQTDRRRPLWLPAFKPTTDFGLVKTLNHAIKGDNDAREEALRQISHSCATQLATWPRKRRQEMVAVTLETRRRSTHRWCKAKDRPVFGPVGIDRENPESVVEVICVREPQLCIC